MKAKNLSRLGMIAFLTQHDSYPLGQVTLRRRQRGRPAMSYWNSRYFGGSFHDLSAVAPK